MPLTADTITDEQIKELFAKHCECRPIDVDRTSHSHDCNDGIVEVCRIALGGKPDGQLYPRSTATAIIQMRAARARCAEILNDSGADYFQHALREVSEIPNRGDDAHANALSRLSVEATLRLVEAVDRLTDVIDEHGGKIAAAMDYISDHLPGDR